MSTIFTYIFVLLAFKARSFDSQDLQIPPPPVCCLKDYTNSDCYNPCFERTCANLKRGPVPCPLYCLFGVCECKDDLYRNECNECVPKEKCGTPCNKSEPIFCTKPNETLYGCFDPTQARVCPSVECSSPRDLFLKYIEQPNTKSLCVLNVCDCQEEYLRNECGECVLPKDCCEKKICGIQCDGINEVVKTIEQPEKCDEEYKERYGDERPYDTKYECVCKDGFERNKCGVCVPCNQVDDDTPCACTNPCRSNPDMEWQCVNPCNEPTCDNYFELPFTSCETNCIYGCYCDSNKDLWWNGTACVKSDDC